MLWVSFKRFHSKSTFSYEIFPTHFNISNPYSNKALNVFEPNYKGDFKGEKLPLSENLQYILNISLKN